MYAIPTLSYAVAPEAQLRPSFQIPQSTAPNLSIITHGWNNNAFLTGWLEDFRSDLRSVTNPNQWDVFTFDWRDQAGGILSKAPHEALFPAPGIGEALGQQIVDRGYERIHLYAHSAGGELMSAAANHIKRIAPEKVVQLTLMDPYVPGLIGLDDGSRADWTDHYFTEDSTALFSYFAWTDDPLPWAHNVDISEFDPFFAIGHIWVHDWYNDTITRSRPEDQGFGFPLSLEAQGESWSPATQYPKGETIALGGIGNAPYKQPVIAFQQRVVDFTALQIREQGGDVTVNPSIVTLNSDGGAWIRLLIDTLRDDVNSLRFSLDFDSTAKDSLAAAYWNDEPVRVVEERLAPEGSTEYVVYLANQDIDRHELAFRLDGTASTMTISNILLEEVVLAATSVIPPGDYNQNGIVDAVDYTIWRNAVAGKQTLFSVDGNRDGLVNQVDYDFWKERFGNTAAGSRESIPEPSSALLLAIATLIRCTLRLRSTESGSLFYTTLHKNGSGQNPLSSTFSCHFAAPKRLYPQ